MDHNTDMKIVMPMILVFISLLVIVGVIFLKRSFPATTTSRGLRIQEASKGIFGPTGAQPTQSPNDTQSAFLNKSAVSTGILLSITSPVRSATVKSSALLVKGVTAPGADVSVNEADVVSDAKGNFIASITLDEGENNIFIVAVDGSGDYTEQEMTVTYDAGVVYQ
jgi:hypothetical protein